MKREGHDAVGGVKRFLDAVAVMNVDVNVEHALVKLEQLHNAQHNIVDIAWRQREHRVSEHTRLPHRHTRTQRRCLQKPDASLFFAWCSPPAQFTATSAWLWLRRTAPSIHAHTYHNLGFYYVCFFTPFNIFFFFFTNRTSCCNLRKFINSIKYRTIIVFKIETN